MYNVETAALIALGGIFIIALVVFVLTLVFTIIGRWTLFKKAGKKGWEAIVPFYSTWTLFEIAELNWWYFLIYIGFSIFSNDSLILSLGMMVISYFCYHNIAKKIGKSTSFAILTTIFPFVMLPIIGLSNNINFDNSIPVSPNGPIDENKHTTTTENVSKETKTSNEPKTEEFKKTPVILKNCLYCGRPLESTDKFCGSCGKELD